jgi:hypothetical protein
MKTESRSSALLLGLFIFLGLAALGFQLGNAALDYREYERSVSVKGLSEREYPADVVIWPIAFTHAGNDLAELYADIARSADRIVRFLLANDIAADEITVAPPAITDKSAQQYGNSGTLTFRYNANQAVTVYSQDIDTVRRAMDRLSELGGQGIVITGGNYDARTEYLFTRLNEVKPAMIEEATRHARLAAEKFASDSNSTLGKIRTASQGQFSISPRDKHNPHIKKVRVVSTVEYYLAD